jgi:hypothetical protein
MAIFKKLIVFTLLILITKKAVDIRKASMHFVPLFS